MAVYIWSHPEIGVTLSNVCAMRGEHGHLDEAKVDMGEMLYRRHGEHGIVEVGPEECPAGHPLAYPNVLNGWDGVGVTYTCRTCAAAGTLPHTLRYRRGG